MNRLIFITLTVVILILNSALISINPSRFEFDNARKSEQDTLMNYQRLYNGIVWTNSYRRINGDQFLFSNYFLHGSVTTNGKTFNNLLIRYDIFQDEISIPVNRDEIVQLNKELIDSFTISFENKVYRFTKIQKDTLDGLNAFKGYYNVLYKNASTLYLKYKKEISPNITEKSDGYFIQSYKVFFVKDKSIYPIKSINDLYEVLNVDKGQVSNYLKNSKLKISKNSPESFVPVIRYFENLGQ